MTKDFHIDFQTAAAWCCYWWSNNRGMNEILRVDHHRRFSRVVLSAFFLLPIEIDSGNYFSRLVLGWHIPILFPLWLFRQSADGVTKAYGVIVLQESKWAFIRQLSNRATETRMGKRKMRLATLAETREKDSKPENQGLYNVASHNERWNN